MGVLRSELDLVTTQYSKNANSLVALESKQELFVKMQDEQRKKVVDYKELCVLIHDEFARAFSTKN